MFFLKEVKYKDILSIKKLHIPKNKITCIVGKSGSGKTTLLKLLNKMIPYDHGEIFYNHKLLNDVNSVELRRKVIMLPQVPAIFPGSIRENLLIGLKFSQKPFVGDSQLLNILETIHLNKDLEEDCKNLSGGEKQRVSLGRVLLLNPEVLLLDEPSSALDEDTEHIMIQSLVGYTKKHHKTMIMVTHSKRIVTHFADEIITIANTITKREV
ncbi:ABC transporter ATP-binding protein [Anaerophilus nitritogenes]|uniref:ABC transporter ATP-binding protein n=1 Tax=Anaerophilus nitritogenes TaxID=2498136 RepID=UPI00101B7855|nr:ATP-binding cassette domain-containing protein [Anaerophilus nitritogenes]